MLNQEIIDTYRLFLYGYDKMLIKELKQFPFDLNIQSIFPYMVENEEELLKFLRPYWAK